MTDVVDKIIAFEQDELTDDEVVELFQHLIDTGQVWHLQGAYGRGAIRLIRSGLCSAPTRGPDS